MLQKLKLKVVMDLKIMRGLRFRGGCQPLNFYAYKRWNNCNPWLHLVGSTV